MDFKKDKEEAILFFLKKYGILIDFKDDSYLEYKKRIPKDDNQTFKSWKEKTFGRSSAKILVFGEYMPANNTKFKNIKSENDAKSLLNVLEFIKDSLEGESEEYIKHEKEKLDKKLEEFPRQLLDDCMEKLNNSNDVHPAVKEFLARWRETENDNIDTEEILFTLLKSYNSCVMKCGRLEGLIKNR